MRAHYIIPLARAVSEGRPALRPWPMSSESLCHCVALFLKVWLCDSALRLRQLPKKERSSKEEREEEEEEYTRERVETRLLKEVRPQ